MEPETDRPALRCVTKGIVDQIPGDLTDPIGVHLHDADVFDLGREPHPHRSRSCLLRMCDLAEMRGQIHIFRPPRELASLETGKHHQIFDEPAEPISLVVHHPSDALKVRSIDLAGIERLGIAADRRQRCT